MIVQSPALVIKSFPYSDTSLIARCFTREMGKLSVIVRGARRKNSAFAAYFQPMNYIELVFYYKQTRELQTLSKASFIEMWSHYHKDLKKIVYGQSAIELTDKTITDHDPHVELFDVLIDILRAFDQNEYHLNLIFWYYELKLLTLLGFKPDFDELNFSGLTLPDPFAGPNSRRILENLRDLPLGTWPDTPVTAKDRQVISDYFSAQFQYHFDGISNLKSFQVLRQILS